MTDMKQIEPIAFMAHIPHTDFDYLEDTIKEYPIGSYAISAETSDTGNQHFHFFIQMLDKDYHSFSKRVFKEKYNLRGRALKDKARQYGKIKKITDLDKMLSYTLKDGNFRTNMPKETIEKAFNKSHQKQETLSKYDEVLTYVEDNWQAQEYNDEYDISKRVAMMIICWMKSNRLHLRATTIRSYTIYCLTYTQKEGIKYNPSCLFNLLFPHGI